ncbi:MAG: lactoylglutathione lyase [Mesorhizobium amorphae]|nr:MAG: lactoylglutathione lyase [Mesorhizobium amorphae]
MSKMIFVNLPVGDLKRSIAFYTAIGATQDLRFSDDTAAAMQISDAIVVMLLTHEKFAQFTAKTIADAKASAQVLLALSADSREAVDALADEASRAGGSVDPSPPQDHGFMYGRSFEDPDGHVWETMWMDMTAFMEATGQAQAD